MTPILYFAYFSLKSRFCLDGLLTFGYRVIISVHLRCAHLLKSIFFLKVLQGFGFIRCTTDFLSICVIMFFTPPWDQCLMIQKKAQNVRRGCRKWTSTFMHASNVRLFPRSPNRISNTVQNSGFTIQIRKSWKTWLGLPFLIMTVPSYHAIFVGIFI